MNKKTVYHYAIHEIRGEFYIFCQYEYMTGFWFWKKNKLSKWQRCASNGAPSVYAPSIGLCINPMPPFYTLADAKKKIELFKKETVIHE